MIGRYKNWDNKESSYKASEDNKGWKKEQTNSDKNNRKKSYIRSRGKQGRKRNSRQCVAHDRSHSEQSSAGHVIDAQT